MRAPIILLSLMSFQFAIAATITVTPAITTVVTTTEPKGGPVCHLFQQNRQKYACSSPYVLDAQNVVKKDMPFLLVSNCATRVPQPCCWVPSFDFELTNMLVIIADLGARPVTNKGCQCLSDCKLCPSYHSVGLGNHLHCYVILSVRTLVMTCVRISASLAVLS